MATRVSFRSRSLQRDMNMFMSKLDRAGANVTLRAAKALRLRLAKKNPKLTGRSAASWNLTVGLGDRSFQPRWYNDVAGSVRAGIVDVSGYQLGKRLIISNHIPYLKALEDGRSDKAPKGFIKNSIMFIKEHIKLGTFKSAVPSNLR